MIGIHFFYDTIYIYCIYIYGVVSKFGYGSARGDPDVWIGLDHPRVDMDRGMDRPVGLGYGSGLYILTRSHVYIYIYTRIINIISISYVCIYSVQYRRVI